MDSVIILFSGMLMGAVFVRWSTVAAHRRRGYRPADEHYAAAVQATVRYLRRHGTVNRRHLEHLMEMEAGTAAQYLDAMERSGVLRAHRHREKEGFYTLA